MNLKIISLLKNQYAVLSKLKVITLVLMFLILNSSVFATTFKVIINPDSNNPISYTFQLDPGESVPQWAESDGKLWEASYSSDGTSFFFNCHYVDYGTYTITGDGDYNVLGGWMANPVRIEVTGHQNPSTISITSPSSVNASSGSSFSYTIQASSDFPITYSASSLPGGFSYDSTNHKITATFSDSYSERTYTFNVSAADGINTATKTVTVHVGNNLFVPEIDHPYSPYSVPQGYQLSDEIYAFGTDPISYGVSSNVSSWFTAPDMIRSGYYTGINDTQVIFNVYASNPGGSDSKEITVEFGGRVEIELYNNADPNDIDADEINPQGFFFTTGTKGTATFSIDHSDVLKVYTDVNCTQEFDGNARNLATEGFPSPLYLKALAPVANATAKIQRTDLLTVSEEVTFDVTMDGPFIAGRILNGTFVSEENEDDPANLVSNNNVIEFALTTGGLGFGELKFEMANTGPYSKIGKFYYDAACTQPVTTDPPYTVNLSNPASSVLGPLATNGSMSLYMKPLAPTNNANAKLTYSYSSYTSNDKVNFKINMASVEITGYKDLAGNDLVADTDEENTSIYQVNGPFKINISRGNLLVGTVNLKVSADDSKTKNAAKIYTDINLTNEVTDMSVDLGNPSGNLAALATNGSMNLYVMPLIPTNSLNIELGYANGGTDTDKLKVAVGMIGVNITGYKGNEAIPEDEEYPSDLIVPAWDYNSVPSGTTPPSVKVKLERGSLISGKIKFSITHESGNNKAVEVYLDENLTKPLKNRSVDITNPTGDMKSLGNGQAGSMYLYIKPIAAADKITAKICYEDGSTSADEFSFKICSECPCTGCVPGEDSHSLGSVNSKFSLGSNSYGKPAGSIYLTSEKLSMDIAGPKALQIASFQNTSVNYTYDPNDSTVVTQIDISTGVNNVKIEFQRQTYGSTTYYPASTIKFYKAGETTPFRTVSVVNNFTATDQGGGNYDFTVAFLEITNTLHQTTGDVVKTTKYEKPDANTWKLNRNNQITEFQQNTIDETEGTRTEVFCIGSSLTAPVYKETNVYKIYPWGEALIQNIGAETTTYEYYDNNATDGMKLGNLKKITYPKGDTVEYTYGANGNLQETLTTKGGHSYKTTREVFSIASVNNGTPAFYAVNATIGTFDYGTLTDTDVLKLLGTKEIIKKYCDNVLTSHSENISYYEHFAGIDQNIVYEDASTPHTTYTEYYADKADTVRYGRVKKVVVPGGDISLYTYSRSGGQETVTNTSGEPNAGGTAVVNGSKSVTVRNENGTVISSTSYEIVNGVETQVGSQTAITIDDFGRVTKTQYMDGTYTERSYGCCGVDWEIDRNGTRTDYMYDDTTKRLTSSTRNGITTLYTYDQAGNTLTTTIKGRNNTELTSTSAYNEFGELTSSTDPMNYITTYSNHGDTVTYPNGTTSITNYTQGVVSGTSGTAVHPATYSTGPNWQKTMPQDITSYSDMLGRQYKTVYADATYTETFYNSKGQPVKVVSPSGKIRITEYDGRGRIYRSAVDMNLNGIIDGNDEITQYTYAFVTKNSKTVSVSTVTRIVNTNSKVLSVTETTLDGLESWTTVNGLVTHSLTERLGNGQIKATVEYPDNSKSITYSTHGLTTKVESYNPDASAGNVVEYVYDEFDRVTTITEKYGETVINEIVNSNFTANGQPLAVTTNGKTTTYVYDNMGRRTSVTLPGGRTINYTYKDTGELATVDGAETYKQSYNYDSQGRMHTLTTYKNASTPQVTTWNYNNRGFMTSKVYADNKGTTYTYNADGQLATRVWARGITTSYTYDNAGRQLTVDYSDTTPDITYTYDWMGNVATVEDAAGTRTFTYDYATSGHPGLVSVTIPSIVNYNISYTYDAYGRKTGMSLKNGSAAVFGNSYGYSSATGRLTSVGDGTYTAHYSWQDGTGLMAQNQIKRDSDSSAITTHNRTYGSRLSNYNLLSVSNTTGAATRAYSYVYNTKDQRTRMTLPDGAYWEYAYDDKGQVVSGVKKDAAGNVIPGQSYGYNYDGIGNRNTTKHGMFGNQDTDAITQAYTSNSVNQYTQITTPGIAPVVGEADTDATVKVIRNDSNAAASGEQVITTDRDGVYFMGMFKNVDNSNSAQNIPYTVYAIKTDYNNNKQFVQKASSSYTVPKKAQAYTYDDDGNMLINGEWTYTWNGENRKIAAEKSDQKLEFAYDFMGRRISKKVYTGSVGNWTLASEKKFVYNGYKQIAEFDSGNVLQKTYTWQPVDLDVPLWVKDGTTYYYYIVDGNKNVRSMVDVSGNEVASYDYNPFGKVVVSSGAYKDTNKYRFSSEYHDDETGLVYYKDRYYDEILSRWTKRDSIGERGGLNLYVFVSNNAVNYTDHLGFTKNKNCGTCGPDATEWYIKDIQEHMKLKKRYGYSVLHFRIHGKYYMSHKWMNFNVGNCATGSCKNTVSVCDTCVRKNQLGNIMFGLIAEDKILGPTPVPFAYSKKFPSVRYKNGKDGALRTDNLAAFALGRYLYNAKTFGKGTNKKSFCQEFKKALSKKNMSYYKKLAGKSSITSKDLTTTTEGFDTSDCAPCKDKIYCSNNTNSITYFKQLFLTHLYAGELHPNYMTWKTPYENSLDRLLELSYENYNYRGPNHAPKGNFERMFPVLEPPKWH